MNSEDIIYPPFSEVDRVPELDKDSCEGCVYNDDSGACHIPIREISIPLFCGIHIFVRKQGPHAPDCAIALNGRHACSCEALHGKLPMVEIETTLFPQKRKGDLPIPEALYSCGVRFCAEETSYPANMLFWSQRFGRWFCEDCWRDWHADGEEIGTSLADELKRHTAQNENEERNLPIPEALYSCGTGSCEEEMSYPADMLFWSEEKQGWFCENCFEEDGEEKGISLAEEIERQKVTK